MIELSKVRPHRIKHNYVENGLIAVARIWLADWAAGEKQNGFWRRFWPRRILLGNLPQGDEVWLLEIPHGLEERAVEGWLKKQLRRIERQEQKRLKKHKSGSGEFRLGLPLALAERLERAYPDVLIRGRRLACLELIRKAKLERGGLFGAEVGLLNVSEVWQRKLADELLAAGAKIALSGSYAKRMAAEYWEEGQAVPVLSQRRLLQNCDLVLVLPGATLAKGVPENLLKSGRIIRFAEPQVFVEGHFCGRFAFGMFAAGMAAAMLQDNVDRCG